jgi:hypothetical protein
VSDSANGKDVNPNRAPQDSLLDKIVSLYERAPVVRMLMAAYPPLAVTEAGLLATYKWWKQRRMYVFADEMLSLNLNPDEEQVKSRDFCEAFGSTASRVLEAKRDEKIRLFAKLFASYVRDNDTTSEAFDVFEEDLNILDELEYREFRLLLLLRRYELDNPPQPEQNQAQRTAPYWGDFQAEAAAAFQLSVDELNAMLQRVQRTGLYQPVTGTYWDYLGNRGFLTPLFERLLVRVGEDAKSGGK